MTGLPQKLIMRLNAILVLICLAFGWVGPSVVATSRSGSKCVMACASKGQACCCVVSHKQSAKSSGSRAGISDSRPEPCPVAYFAAQFSYKHFLFAEEGAAPSLNQDRKQTKPLSRSQIQKHDLILVRHIPPRAPPLPFGSIL